MKLLTVPVLVALLAGCTDQPPPVPGPTAGLPPAANAETHEACRMAEEVLRDPTLGRQQSFMGSLQEFGGNSDVLAVRAAAEPFNPDWLQPDKAKAATGGIAMYANRIRQACAESGVA